jgi:cytochrome c553
MSFHRARSLVRALIATALPLVGASSVSHAADALFPLDSIDQRVLACTPCHGKEGRATSDGYFPRIAGKPAGYLYNQLLNFRDGRRHFPMMAYLTDRQTDSFLREIAGYFAAQHLPYPPPQPANLGAAALERGRTLVMDGDAAQDIPACGACHGTQLMGVAPAVPGLLGLSHDYLIGQLGAWRGGTRHAHAPDCMAQIVSRMSQQDLAAATAWLAMQEVPAGALPEQAFEQPPPLECGSIANAEAEASAQASVDANAGASAHAGTVAAP